MRRMASWASTRNPWGTPEGVEYPEWIWLSYDMRPAWAEEASIDEWARRKLQERARKPQHAHSR
jgi:hypothetical protein